MDLESARRPDVVGTIGSVAAVTQAAALALRSHPKKEDLVSTIIPATTGLWCLPAVAVVTWLASHDVSARDES